MVHRSELQEWLSSYEGPRYHALLSDPPYALISIAKRFGPGQAAAQEGTDGRYSRLSSGFMGQRWDGFDSLEHYQDWISEWAAQLIDRALLPGAVALFFGGTRTFHHLGVGLERGGFEILDTIMWLHGQGFPKSHDIGKGLDKAAGAERKTIGTKRVGLSMNPNLNDDNWHNARGDEASKHIDITSPATPEAEIWDGYGTALKPAWEPIFLCRAPRAKREGHPWPWDRPSYSFAQLAVEFGSGALNIGGSRISGSVPGTIQGQSERQGKIIYRGKDQRNQREFVGNESGRWPANLMLSHTDECVKVGEYEVEGRTINRFKQGMMPFGGAEGEEYETEEMPPDIVERWACVPGCPVRMLDDQAGDRTSARVSGNPNNPKRGGATVPLWGMSDGEETWDYRDTGGPSRFFYTAKASRAEKDKGLEEFYWARTGNGFLRIHFEEWYKLEKKNRAHGCIHPTVKPLELLRYLANLIKPPDTVKSRLLVPFSGSGSEMIGALQADWNEVEGVELEENYIMMAEARIRANIGML